MITVDTSALMAIILREPEAEACTAVLEAESEVLISAGTIAEAFIVAHGHDVLPQMTALIEELGFKIEPVTASMARRVSQAYAQWGKGVHPARLNFGDCFAYATAKEHACPLLYIGKDFAQTDLASAINP